MPESKRLLTLFFLSTFCVTSSVLSMEEFLIERNSQDSFTIPNSICANDTESQCQSMGGKQESGTSSQTRCKCECSLKKVFGFFNDAWKCERNHDVRTFFAQECSVSLSGSLDMSIYTVPDPDLSQFIETSVSNSCHLNRNFTYLDCNGEWQQIQDSHYGFELVKNNLRRAYYLHSLEETKFDDFSPSIRGKIITLRISCTRKDYCVVLKVRGKLKCPFINPITVKPTSQYSGTVGNQSGKDNSGVIGGAIGGVIILLVAVVLIVLVMAITIKRAANIGIQPETSHSALGDELVDDFEVDGYLLPNGRQTPNQNGAEEMIMNPIPDFPREPATISTNVRRRSQRVELQEPAELYVSMKDDVLQYDYASVNGVPGSNQNIPKGMQQIPGAFEYDYVSVNGEPRSNQNKSAEGMQQRSIPDAFEYDYVAMDGDLRFVNNRTKGMCQHSIPVSRTHNKEDIPDPANHEPNEYINKKDEPEDGLSSESAYQPLQIKSPEDGVYQSLDKTSRAVNASERR